MGGDYLHTEQLGVAAAIADRLFRDHFVRAIEGSAGSPMFSVYQTRPDVLRSRFRGFCTVFGFSLFGRVGVIPGLVSGIASATRAPCGQSPEHPYVLRGQKAPRESVVAKSGFRLSVFSLSFIWAGCEGHLPGVDTTN